MEPVVIAGNILGEATAPSGNIDAGGLNRAQGDVKHKGFQHTTMSAEPRSALSSSIQCSEVIQLPTRLQIASDCAG